MGGNNFIGGNSGVGNYAPVQTKYDSRTQMPGYVYPGQSYGSAPAYFPRAGYSSQDGSKFSINQFEEPKSNSVYSYPPSAVPQVYSMPVYYSNPNFVKYSYWPNPSGQREVPVSPMYYSIPSPSGSRNIDGTPLKQYQAAIPSTPLAEVSDVHTVESSPYGATSLSVAEVALAKTPSEQTRSTQIVHNPEEKLLLYFAGRLFIITISKVRHDFRCKFLAERVNRNM